MPAPTISRRISRKSATGRRPSITARAASKTPNSLPAFRKSRSWADRDVLLLLAQAVRMAGRHAHPLHARWRRHGPQRQRMGERQKQAAKAGGVQDKNFQFVTK